MQFCDGFLLNCETPSTAQCLAVDTHVVFSFKYCSMALCMILRDSSSLLSLFLFVTSV